MSDADRAERAGGIESAPRPTGTTAGPAEAVEHCDCLHARRYRELLERSKEKAALIDLRGGEDEQLAQSQKLQALGRLAGGVAHDFNNMLSVILSYSEIVLDALEPGDLRADIEIVHKAAESAADLTRQLLAFSHQQVLRPTVIDLGQITGGMKKMLGRVLGEDISLALLDPTAECCIHADPSQIERVIMNLAVNARDAMPQGGTLPIEVRRVDVDPRAFPSTPGSRPARASC